MTTLSTSPHSEGSRCRISPRYPWCCRTRSVALAHLVRQEDGLSECVWAGHTLRSAFQPIYGLNGERLEMAAYEGLLRAFRDGEQMGAFAAMARGLNGVMVALLLPVVMPWLIA